VGGRGEKHANQRGELGEEKSSELLAFFSIKSDWENGSGGGKYWGLYFPEEGGGEGREGTRGGEKKKESFRSWAIGAPAIALCET